VAEARHRRATLADADALALTIRPADAAEVEAWGLTPREALRHSVSGSLLACTTTFDGAVAAMWGVAPGKSWMGGSALGGTRCAWLLTGLLVEAHPFTFHREAKAIAKTLIELWGPLANAVDVRHERSLAWLQRLGGTVDGVLLVNGYPFNVVTLR
jgi:hypothetical protein